MKQLALALLLGTMGTPALADIAVSSFPSAVAPQGTDALSLFQYADGREHLMTLNALLQWLDAQQQSSGVLSYVPLSTLRNLADLSDPAVARTNLGLATVAHTGQYADLAGLPTLFSGRYADLTGVPAAITNALVSNGNGSGLTGITAAQVGALPLTGGTLSGNLFAPVLATGGSVARSLSDRAGGMLSVLDFGAACDGVTDDTLRMQAAMDKAAALQVDLMLAPRGMMCRASELNFLTHARLRIDGVLQTFGNNTTPINNHYAYTLSGTPEYDVVIDGDGVIDNNMTARGAAHPSACIYIFGATHDITIRNITIQNCGNGPFDIASFAGNSGKATDQAHHIRVEHVKIAGLSYNASGFTGCDDCVADDLTIYQSITDDFLFAFYGGDTNSAIINSHFDGNSYPGTMGIGVLSDAGQTAPSSNILIQGNEVGYVADCAVWVQGTSTASSGQTLKHKNIRIIGNDGHNNNTSHTENWGGECILDASGVTSMGNFWHDDGAGSGTSAGIYLYTSSAYTQASDNFKSIGDTIFNEGAGGGVGLGVVIGAGAIKPSFYNTSFYDTQATPTMAQAFNGSCNSDCTIIGSKIDAATVGTAFGGLIFAGGTTTAPPATIFGNGPYANYISGDVVIPGNSTNGGVGIFNGGLLATLPNSCSGQRTGTIYDNGDHVARVCP